MRPIVRCYYAGDSRFSAGPALINCHGRSRVSPPSIFDAIAAMRVSIDASIRDDSVSTMQTATGDQGIGFQLPIERIATQGQRIAHEIEVVGIEAQTETSARDGQVLDRPSRTTPTTSPGSVLSSRRTRSFAIRIARSANRRDEFAIEFGKRFTKITQYAVQGRHMLADVIRGVRLTCGIAVRTTRFEAFAIGPACAAPRPGEWSTCSRLR